MGPSSNRPRSQCRRKHGRGNPTKHLRIELAAALILNADNKHFGGLKSDLKTNYARRTDQWPKTLTAAYNLLVMQELQERHERSSQARIPRNTDPVTPQTLGGISSP